MSPVRAQEVLDECGCVDDDEPQEASRSERCLPDQRRGRASQAHCRPPGHAAKTSSAGGAKRPHVPGLPGCRRSGSGRGPSLASSGPMRPIRHVPNLDHLRHVHSISHAAHMRRTCSAAGAMGTQAHTAIVWCPCSTSAGEWGGADGKPTIEASEQVAATSSAGGNGYDEARTVHNGMIDRRPAVVVRAEQRRRRHGRRSNFARENGLDLAVRGGGHSVPGFGTNDDGVVRRPVRDARCPRRPGARTARAGAAPRGATSTTPRTPSGWPRPAGSSPRPASAGSPWAAASAISPRGYGCRCDNLVSADVVTADGKFVSASETENADLFWALRGGGGNFGVVTSFEFRLHPVNDDLRRPDVLRARRTRGRSCGSSGSSSPTRPSNSAAFPAFQIAPPLPFIPEDRHGDPFVAGRRVLGRPAGRGREAR